MENVAPICMSGGACDRAAKKTLRVLTGNLIYNKAIVARNNIILISIFLNKINMTKYFIKTCYFIERVNQELISNFVLK
jgi:hypothetical protein